MVEGEKAAYTSVGLENNNDNAMTNMTVDISL